MIFMQGGTPSLRSSTVEWGLSPAVVVALTLKVAGLSALAFAVEIGSFNRVNASELGALGLRVCKCGYLCSDECEQAEGEGYAAYRSEGHADSAGAAEATGSVGYICLRAGLARELYY